MAAVFVRYLRPYIVGSRSLCLCLARPILCTWAPGKLKITTMAGGGEEEAVNSNNNRVLMAKTRLQMAMKRLLMAKRIPDGQEQDC
jgi:hypothetical protein